MTGVRGVLWSAWLPSALLVSWELSARAGVVDALFFPAPTSILETARRLTATGELTHHLIVTLVRLSLAVTAAGAAGLACGLLMGLSERVNRSLEPIVSALYTTPKITLLPMLFLLVGIGEPARIIAVAAGGFIIVALHAFDAVRGVNRAFVDMAVNYGAGRWQLVRRVYIPSALPQIFTGLRLAVGRSIVMVITVEIVSAHDGLGSLIWVAGQTLAIEKLYVGVLMAALLGGISHAALRRLEAALVPWRTPRSGG